MLVSNSELDAVDRDYCRRRQDTPIARTTKMELSDLQQGGRCCQDTQRLEAKTRMSIVLMQHTWYFKVVLTTQHLMASSLLVIATTELEQKGIVALN